MNIIELFKFSFISIIEKVINHQISNLFLNFLFKVTIIVKLIKGQILSLKVINLSKNSNNDFDYVLKNLLK